MRACPKCGHPNDDDSGYCVIDGAPLGERLVVDLAEPEPEILTQVVSKQAPAPLGPVSAAPPAVRPGFIYGMIGALAAAVVLLGGYVVLLSGRDDGNGNNQPMTSPSPLLGTNGIVNSSPVRIDRPAAPANAPANTTIANAVNVPIPPANKPVVPSGGDTSRRFDRTYSGSVGDSGVRMSLQRDGGSLSGRVYPQGRYADIYLDGWVERDGTFAMDERSDLGIVTGVYRGRLNADGSMTGTWSKPDGDKTRSIHLRRQ